MALRRLEDVLGKRLGDVHDPLLVSVRSGAKFSMPGMMETVLNVGLNDYSVNGLIEASGNERFAWDSYRRLVQMFGKTVLGIEGEFTFLSAYGSNTCQQPNTTIVGSNCKVMPRQLATLAGRAGFLTEPGGRTML